MSLVTIQCSLVEFIPSVSISKARFSGPFSIDRFCLQIVLF
jgi:hypothetical protein